MADGGPGPGLRTNVFQARLNTALAGVSSTLTLLPYKGNKILVNGQNVTVPDAGMTRLVGANLITAAGADSGGAGAASTLYYVYVSNAKATFSPSSIRLSATAPSLVTGVKYLNTSGNGLNWRFVGWVRLNATPQFEFSTSNAYIVNYYNRWRLSIFANPGYVNDDAFTSYGLTSTTYVELNGGAGARVNFISNGEDEVHFEATFVTQMSPAGFSGQFGIGVDSVAGPEDAGWTGGIGYTTLNATEHTVYDSVLSEGVHFCALLGLSNTGTNIVIYADFARDGGAADPRATMIRGFVNA